MPKKIAKVMVPVTDIWAKPAFESSRLTQVLFGERVEIQRKYQNYVRVKCEDDYVGWLNASHVKVISPGSPLHAQSVIRVPVAEIYSGAKSKTIISRLSFGSKIEYDQKLSGMLRLHGMGGWIKEANLRLKRPPRISARAIISALRMFLGVPYLWGGKSGFGLDCSGLIQSVYNFYGHKLPRDSKDQMKKGRSIIRENLKAGDLIFSPGHAAVYMGKGDIIHASLKAGGVKIESINPGSNLYREDIDKKIIEIRRVI